MVLLSCFMCIFLPMCSLLVICFIVICKWVNGYWIRKGVTTLKPRLFFGNAIDVVLQRKCLSDSVKDFHNSLKEKGQPYGGYYFLMRPVLVVTDLELIKRILITDFEHFVDHPAYINDDEPLSNHIFSLKGDRWKQLRAKLTPAFTSSKLKMMLGLFLKCCKDLEVEMDKKIIKDDVVDIGSAMEKLIMDIIGSCAFGLECNSFKSTSSDFHKYGSRFFHEPSLKGSVMHILSLVVPEIFKYINVRVLDAEMTDFFTNLVNDMVKYREENNIIRKDLMHLLLQLKNDGKVCEEEVGDIKGELGEAGNVPLTSTELVSQCFVFFIAGVETTAFALTILMYELSTNQKIQDKVREEIIAVLKKNRGRITYEAILEMKYLHKCICESLRKYPPAGVQTRVCTKKYRIPDTEVILSEGTPVFISTQGIQCDSSCYPNPEQFDPERFDLDQKSSLPSCAWFPFGAGPRWCIGNQFGLMQMKVGMITLLRRYKFDLHPSTKIPISFDPKTYLLNTASPIFLSMKKI